MVEGGFKSVIGTSTRRSDKTYVFGLTLGKFFISSSVVRSLEKPPKDRVSHFRVQK